MNLTIKDLAEPCITSKMMVLKNNQCLLKTEKETQPDTMCLLIGVYNSSEFRYTSFGTHPPALNLTPVALALISTFLASWEERFLSLQPLPQNERFVRVAS